MRKISKTFISFTILSILFLSACTSQENVDVEQILDTEDAFSLNMGDLPLLTFREEGMKIINSDSIGNGPDGYPFPFEPEELYQDYELTHTEDLLRIESDNIIYELTILGPRRFRDEENDIELESDLYLLEDSVGSN